MPHRQRPALQRVARRVPAPCLLPRQRAVLHQQPPGVVIAPAVPAERVVVALLADQVIAPVIVPVPGPAPRRRTLRAAAEHVALPYPAETVILRAAGQQPLGAAHLAVQFVTGEVADRQAVERDAQQMSAAVIKLLQLSPVGQAESGAVAQRVVTPRQLALFALLADNASQRIILKRQFLLGLLTPEAIAQRRMLGDLRRQTGGRIAPARLHLRRGAGKQLTGGAPAEGMGDRFGITRGECARDSAATGVIIVTRRDAIEPDLFQQQRVRSPAEAIRLAVLIMQRRQSAAAVPTAPNLFARRVARGDQAASLVVAKLAALAVRGFMRLRQPPGVPAQRLLPALRTLQLQRTTGGIIAITRLLTVRPDLRFKPAERMITITRGAA